MREGVCECNVYHCLNCGKTQGHYHGSNNCIGKEYNISWCEYCAEDDEE